MIRAIVIHPDATYRIEEVDAGYTGLRDLVGGWIEAVETPDYTTIYLNEEGKLLGLPRNGLATQLWRMLDPRRTDFLCGTVVVLGPVDGAGNETPVTDETIATFRKLVTA